MTDLAEPPVDETTAPRRRFTFTKVVLTVVCLLLLAMWVYAFGFASKKAAYRVDDAAWRERAQETCARYEAQRLELVDTADGLIEDPTPEQMRRRADLVDAATDILEAQLADVTATMPTTERDRSLVIEYRDYYRTVIADRRAYTARLRDLDLAPYRETAIDGSPVSNLLNDFAVVNRMGACAPPTDLST